MAMHNLLRTFLLLAILLLGGRLPAQYLEMGAMLGTANYLGDLSNNSGALYLRESKPAVGALVRFNIGNHISLRSGLTSAWISGRDANVRNDDFIRRRNLSFRTNILELSLVGEVNIPGYQPYGLLRAFSPYLYGGVAVFRFNPKTRYQGEWVALQPLGTEGQGIDQLPDRAEPYILSGFAIPFGIGVKYALTDRVNLGLDLGARFAYTDYLDDVSTTYASYPELLAGNGPLAAALGNRTGELDGGDPVAVETGTRRGDLRPNDWYFLLGATISYNLIENGLMGSRQRLRRRSGCNTTP
ncbi:MAG: hypothetical protein RLY31_734 [Bacteroidota bacterium]